MTLGSYKRNSNNKNYINLIRTTSLAALVPYFRLLLMKFVVGFLCPKHWLNLPHPSLCSPRVTIDFSVSHRLFFHSLSLLCISLCVSSTQKTFPPCICIVRHIFAQIMSIVLFFLQYSVVPFSYTVGGTMYTIGKSITIVSLFFTFHSRFIIYFVSY